MSTQYFTPVLALVMGLLVYSLGIDPGMAAQPNYGADEANKAFFFDQSQLGGTDGYNYLALRDHNGPSGVPLGGIGTGYFCFTPDGSFTRISFSNTHHSMGSEAGKGCFFTLWQRPRSAANARRMVRDKEAKYGMPGYQHTTYTGLFPTARLSYDNDPEPDDNVKVSVYAYSGLVPHNIKDSSLPVAFFDVTLSAREAADVTLALSWEDFIGRDLRDPKSLEGMDGQIFQNDRFNLVDGYSNWEMMPRVPTSARLYRSGKWQGVLQYAARPIVPKKKTFQGYNTQFAIVAETGNDASVSVLPAYPVTQGDAPWTGLIKNGTFGTAGAETPLSTPDSPGMASVVALSTKLAKGQSKTVRFMVAWYMPEFKIDRQKDHPGSFWSTCDYGRYYHNYFESIDSLISYAGRERARILKQTEEWHKPVLASTVPDWLKFKLINSAYTIFTNAILNKEGDITFMEGAMAGLAGTMDQRISAHPFYQKFFTELDRNEMQRFADCQSPEGYILHFLGHYYVGMAPKGGPAPTEGGWMLDNTGGWIIQLAKDYQQTGDIEYLKHNAEHIRRGLAHLKSQMKDDVQIPIGPTTYDDFRHPPVYSYMAGTYLAILRAGAMIGEALGDQQMARECNIQIKKSYADMMRLLWNGRFFAYGCDLDGSNRRDDLLFTGQIAGQFMSRYCGWGDVLPMDIARASLVSQFKTSLSHTPDYYANKVWDLNQMKGIDQFGSQCWPFYLESYTAMPAIQAGYVADGLDIMRHIQLVHLRLGYTWCQNLWNPGQITYMTAPVTWFITDVLAGSNLDVPKGTLYLAPIIPNQKQRLELPIYFPDFWATLKCDPASKKASLHVTKTFGKREIKIRRLRSEPVGVPTSKGVTVSIPEFTVEEGAVLDLSPYWSQISACVLRGPVLPQADKVDFITVDN